MSKCLSQSQDVEIVVRESVLPFLPAKSLLKFRTISRDWNHIINKPFFNHKQSHSFRKMSGLFNQSSNGSSFISLDEAAFGVPDPSLGFLPVPVEIKSSCNGLLCCQGKTGQKLYYVCNPLNKEWTVLPKPICDHGQDPAVVLVFEPSILNFAADYKVVCAIQSKEFPEATEFEIYSSDKRSWELSREICFNQKVDSGTGLYINKTIYWLSSHGILTFDPVNEHAATHGSGYYGRRVSRILIEMYGQPCYVTAINSFLTVNVVNLYMTTQPMVLTKDSEVSGDSSKLSVAIDKQIMGTNSSAEVLPTVGGDVLVIKVGGTIASYHIFTKEFKVLTTGQEYVHGKYFPYVNSLVSLSSA